MPNFSESLTVRILGDSSHLQRELDAVQKRIGQLGKQLSQLEEAGAGLSRTADRIAALARPLERVSRLFDRVTNQARSLGRIPITLNVAPALNALAVLLSTLNLVAARMRALSLAPAVDGFGGFGGGAPAPPARNVPRLNSGGLVRGPSGVDRIPALLTAGEFVLRSSVVQQLGLPFLTALNRTPAEPTTRPARPSAPPATPASVTNFGGVSINVTRSADVNAIVRDLRFQGLRLRNRRG